MGTYLYKSMKVQRRDEMKSIFHKKRPFFFSSAKAKFVVSLRKAKGITIRSCTFVPDLSLLHCETGPKNNSNKGSKWHD